MSQGRSLLFKSWLRLNAAVHCFFKGIKVVLSWLFVCILKRSGFLDSSLTNDDNEGKKQFFVHVYVFNLGHLQSTSHTFKLKPATHVCISGLLTDTSLTPFVCAHITVVEFYPWVQEV